MEVGMPRAVLVGLAGLCLAACGGSSAAPTRPVGGTPAANGASSAAAVEALDGTPSSSGATPAEITLTTAADCQAMAGGLGPITWTVLGGADNGNTYRMTRCQAVYVVVLNSATDPCHWTTVQTTNSRVMALLPLPLPAWPPPGGTDEVYGAISSGQAMLTSTLSCPDGSTQQTWSVTVDVTG
jgi:hypothetical protein